MSTEETVMVGAAGPEDASHPLAPVQGQRRYIGFRHRIKQTKAGEAHPTQLCIDGRLVELDDEDDELDFLLERLPTKWRAVEEGEDLSKFPEHHVERDTEGKPKRVPEAYEGLKKGDIVGAVLGGSGDYFSYALANHGESIGAEVYRIAPFMLKQKRGHDDRTNDAPLLASLVEKERSLFYKVYLRERDLIAVRELLKVRIDAMKARIACEQRLGQRLIGEIFCNPEGKYPQGSIEKIAKDRKANDRILLALETEEELAEKQLTKAVEKLDIYHQLRKDVKGLGPLIATRLICAVQDIRRFETAPKLKAFCGVHVLKDGRFPRRRNDSTANWAPDARQSLYLLADQFNRQAKAGTKWGDYLILCKKRLREKHPEKVQVEKLVDGKMKKVWMYTDGHIHKMGIWRCLTRFVEWMFKEWWRIEREAAKTLEGK